MPDPSLQPLVQQGWTALHPVLTSFLSGITGAGLLTLGASTWITARVKGGIDAEYARALETLKVVLSSEANARLEVHKAELKQNGDAEVEKLRSQLAAANTERNTLLSALTTRRFDAIAEVHGALRRFHWALAALTASFRPNGTDEDALRKAVFEASTSFNEKFIDNEIFLTEATAQKIEFIRQTLIIKGNLFTYTVALNVHAPDRGVTWAEIDAEVRGPIREAIDELARELRALMGDRPGAAVLSGHGGASAGTSAAGA